MNKKVRFPVIERDKIVYSNKLNKFFNKNNINPVIDDFFYISELEKLFQDDIQAYYEVKLELELKGFNFDESSKLTFSQDVDWDNTKYLFTNKKGHISPSDFKKTGLSSLIFESDNKTYDFFNFVPLSRLIYLSKYQLNLEDILKKAGFEVKEKKSSNNHSEDLNSRKLKEGGCVKEHITIEIVDANTIENKQEYRGKTNHKIITFNKVSESGEESDSNHDNLMSSFSEYKDMLFNKTKTYNYVDKKRPIININNMYETFITGALIFGFDNFDNFENLKWFFSDKDYESLKNNKRLIDYLKIFKEINCNIEIEYDNFNQFSEKIRLNKSEYITNATYYNTYVHLYTNIQQINNENNNFNICYTFNDVLSNSFLDNNIKNISDLKNKTPYELYKVFKKDTNSFIINKKIKYLKESVATIILEKLDDILSSLKWKHSTYIIEQRSKGKTLNEVGNQIGLTRERVRQIESKILKDKEIKKLDMYLKGLSEDGFVLLLDDLNEYIGEQANIIFYMYDKKFEEINAFVFLDNNQVIKEIIDKLKNSDTYILETEVDKFINNLENEIKIKLSKSFLLALFNRIYFKKGIYYFNKNPNLVSLYEIILKNHFNDYQGLSTQTVPHFKQIYFDVFDDDSIFDKTDRAVIARAVDNPNIILQEKGSYSYDNDEVDSMDDSLYKDIYNYIIEKESIYTEAVFKRFESKLFPQIKNRFELHSKLKTKYPELFFTKDFVGIKINPFVDRDKIISDYLTTTNGIVDIKTVANDLPDLQGFNISQYMAENKDFISMFNKRFIHKSYVDISDSEITILSEKINQILENQLSVSAHMVMKIMQNHTDKLIIRNEIYANVYAFHVVRVFLKDEFYFEYPNIFKEKKDVGGDIFYNNNKNIIENVNIYDKISIEKIRIISENNHQEISNMKEYLEYFYENGYMRVDNNFIMKKEKVLNENSHMWTREVERILLPALSNGNKILVNDIDLTLLPKAVKWNNHLLAHLLINNSKQIKVYTVGRQYNNLDYELERI